MPSPPSSSSLPEFTIETIIAISTDQRVVIRATIKQVVAETADEGVFAAATVEQIGSIAVIAAILLVVGDQVVTVTAPERIVPQAAIDGVVLVVAGDLDIEVKTIRNLENLDTDSILKRIARDMDDGRVDAADLGIEIFDDRQAVWEDMIGVVFGFAAALAAIGLVVVVDVDLVDPVVQRYST